MYTKSYGSSNTVANRRWSDVDTGGDGQLFKLIEIPFSPFQSNESDDDDDDDEDDSYGSGGARNRSYGFSSSSRQEYLRSFTFCRKQTMQERVKIRMGRIKAAACAVVACNYYSLPRRLRRMKEKLALKSALRGPRSVRSPFLQAPCFRA